MSMMCESSEQAKEWQTRLIQVAYGGDVNITDQLPPKKKILALLNPFGGMGLAPRKWEVAKQIIDKAHIDVTLKETERQMHAYDIVKDEL